MYRIAMTVAAGVGLLVLGCDDQETSTPAPDAASTADVGAVDGRVPDAAGPRLCVRDDQCPNGTFCPDESGRAVCAPGCRTEPDSCRGADRFTVCEPESRACVPAPCEGDDGCPAGRWCEGGACVEGCRLQPDDCGPLDGTPRGCDPETRSCVALTPCCAADDSCSMALEAACDGQVMRDSATCRPHPCGVSCETDDDCAPGARCSGDGRCVDGCRRVRGDCPGDTVCDPDLHRCVAGACVIDRDCPDWMYCGDAGVCLTGCRTDPDSCPDGTRCGPGRQCGAACVDDASCGEARYCDAVESVCRAACVPETHAGCEAFERCDAGRCVAGCADDPADIAGDDGVAEAPEASWSGGAVQTARYADRIACPADPDLLAVDGPRVEATLRYDEVSGVLALRILDPAGAPLAQDTVGGSPKRLVVDAPRAFVEVSGDGLVGPVPYRLELRRTDADGCFPDALDPIDDGVEGARRLGQRPQQMFVDLVEGAACPGDVDWACFTMATDDGLDAVLGGCPGLEAAIYTADAAAAGGEPTHRLEADGERLRFLADPERAVFADGEWCVAVRNPGAERCEDYALALTFQRRGELCGDALEPDDRADDALVLDGDGPLGDAAGRLPYGVAQSLPAAPRLCPGDTDHYRLTASADDAVEAWVVADGPGANALVVDLLDADGRPRGSRGGASAPGASPVPARAAAADEGALYVVVRGDVEAAVDYTLFVRRTPGNGTCPEDGWENVDVRDDTGADAQRPADTEPGRMTVSGAALCNPEAPDEDWYRIPIAEARTRVCIDAAFRHAVVDMNVQVFRAPHGQCRPQGGEQCCAQTADCDPGFGCAAGFCRAPIAEGISRTDDEFVELDKTRMDVADDLLVRVFRDPDDRPGVDDGPATYDLTVTRAPATPDRCPPDWHERSGANDNRATATPLGSTRRGLCDTWICDDERAVGDWFTIRVPAGSDRTVFIDFDAGEGNLLLAAIDPNRTPERIVESVERQGDVQCINVRGGAADRTVLLQVTADSIEPGGDLRVDYNLRIEPTDLGDFPRGACDDLSGGVFPDVQWPRLDP